MTKYFVGCSGWRYGSWASGFYPSVLGAHDYLAYYSRVFDLASVVVQPARVQALKRWDTETPDSFRFLVRVPKQATNPDHLGKYLEGLAPIGKKILAVVLQVPASLKLLDGREWLDKLLRMCADHGYSAAVEFGNASWLQDMAYNLLRMRGAAIAWSDRHPAVVTSDFVCLQISGNEEAWIKKIREQDQLEFASITVDSPVRANRVLKMLDLPEKKYALSMPAFSEPWTGRVIMCVDLNAFYPSCEELREPELVGKPHAVIMTDQKDRITKGVVSSCSYEARKFGVRSAMPLARALALCPDLVLRSVDIPYYQQVSEKVIGVLEQFADVLEQASIDEAFLDCTKSAAGDPYKHLSCIKGAIKDQCGLMVSVGVAPNKSVAKIACDFKKPDGLTVVHPDRLGSFLAPLEVGRMSGIGAKTQQALKKMGIETIGQLAACDVQMLMERFGRNGLWMWRVANGSDDEAVQQRDDPVSLSTEHTLDEFSSDKGKLISLLNDLVDVIYERLVSRGYAFRTVGVKLVRTNFAIETREMSFSDLQSSRESISSVIEHLLGRFSIDDSVYPVRKVGLRVTNLAATEKGDLMQRTISDYM